jgi:hypothetical protein
VITIPNWENFQHYKRRRPPWIKLYTELADKREWRNLSDGAARLLVELWIIASHDDGRISSTDDIVWALRYTPKQEKALPGLLHELSSVGLILQSERHASNVPAPCQQDAIPEERRDRVQRRGILSQRQTKKAALYFISKFNGYFGRDFRVTENVCDLVRRAFAKYPNWDRFDLAAAAWAAYYTIDDPEILGNFVPKTILRVTAQRGNTLAAWRELADERWRATNGAREFPWDAERRDALSQVRDTDTSSRHSGSGTGGPKRDSDKEQAADGAPGGPDSMRPVLGEVEDTCTDGGVVEIAARKPRVGFVQG